MATFDIFQNATKKELRVGYISTDRGMVNGVTVCEANAYAKLNPGTTFIFNDRDKVKYMNIVGVNSLTANDLVSVAKNCDGIQLEKECGPVKAHFYGGGGIGVQANPVVGVDGALLAVDLIHGGFGYQYPPMVEVKDNCGIGVGAVAKTLTEEEVETTIYYDQLEDFEEYELCEDNTVGFGTRFSTTGKDIGEWNPHNYMGGGKNQFDKVVDDYIDQVNSYTNPWWTTRDEPPLKITSDGKTTRAKYDVKHYAWGGRKNVIPGEQQISWEVVPQSPPPEKDAFKEVEFKIYTQGGSDRGLQFVFTANDNSHNFTIKADDYSDGAAAVQVPIKVKVNTTYNVQSAGSHRGRYDDDPTKGTEQGLLQTFGRKARELAVGSSNKIFADLHGTNNDNDDLQVEAKLGTFTSSNRRTVHGHSTYDLTYRLDDNSAFIAPKKPKKKKVIKEGPPTIKKVVVDSFMNDNAISPHPPSNVKGSDHAGKWYTFEWDVDFGWSGDYIFRGQCDNEARLFLDNQPLSMKLNIWKNNPTRIKKNVQVGIHTVRLELLNYPVKEKVIKQAEVVNETRTVGSVKTIGGVKTVFKDIKQIICHAGGGLGGVDDRHDTTVGGRVVIGKGGAGSVGQGDNWAGKHHGGCGGSAGLRSGQNPGYTVTHVQLDALGVGKYKGGAGGYGANFDGKKTGTQDATVAKVEGQGGDAVAMGGGGGGNAKMGRGGNGAHGGVQIKFNGGVTGDLSVGTRSWIQPGEYTLKIPGKDTVSFNAICIGGGGSGHCDKDGNDQGGGGSGGAYAYIENYELAGGSELKVVVGRGGQGSTNDGSQHGTDSYVEVVKLAEVIDTTKTIDTRKKLIDQKLGSLNMKGVKTHEVFNTIDYMEKANRKLWRTNVYNKGGFLNDYGVCPFDTSLMLSDNPYAGTHTIKWHDVDFPITGDYVIEMAVDDNVRLKIDGQVDIFKEGFLKIGSKEGRGQTPGTGPSKYVRRIRAGRYTITADLDQIPGGKFGFQGVKGINPMALGIKINTAFLEQEKDAKRSWNENPMGVALTIEAPMPPIPQEPIPQQEGRCPNNPTWSTRFPGAKEKWYPVRLEGWGPLLNKYGMSPVAPRSDLGTSGAGRKWRNEWTRNFDFGGFYKLKATVDDIGKVYIDGELKIDLSRRRNKIRDSVMVGIDSGPHTIAVEVENYNYETFKQVEKRIFSTADWAVKPRKRVVDDVQIVKRKNVDVTFKTSSSSWFPNSITIFDGSLLNAPLFVDSKTEYGKGGQFKGTHTHNIQAGKVYDVRFTSQKGGGGTNIEYSGLKRESDRLFRSDKRLEFDDDSNNGFDVNGSFTIDNVRKGTAKFATDGKSLVVNGHNVEITLTYTWNDIPNYKGKALDQIKIGTTTWNQRDVRRGSETHTITLSSGLISNNEAIKLRNKGENVVQMEDYTDNSYDDIICSSSHGKFYDFKGRTCKFMVTEASLTKTVTKDKVIYDAGTLSGATKDGVTYSGTPLASYRSSKSLGAYLSPLLSVNTGTVTEEIQDKTWNMKWEGVNFPKDGTYTVQIEADDVAKLRVDGKEVGQGIVHQGTKEYTFKETKGKKTIEIELYNIRIPNSNFNINPTVVAANITTQVQVLSTPKKSWQDNPMGISAVLIPPPCPKKVKGKGVVTEVLITDPGNGYPNNSTPGDPGTYPVSLRLKRIDIIDVGMNLSKDDKVKVDDIELDIEIDGFGSATRIPVPDPPPEGFNKYPNIATSTATGIPPVLVPVFEPVRDPLKADPDKLIQVTDLVGIKRTGYYEGRPYYGAVFYKDGVRYAGWYETAGELIQIYDTMQESIDAQVTTPPSAILKQGSDVSSNDPKLNLPGTPENLI